MATTYTFADITSPAGGTDFLTDISDNGAIVGYYGGANGSLTGFVFTGGTYTAIIFPGAFVTEPGGINDPGDITGIYGTGTNVRGVHHAYEYLD